MLNFYNLGMYFSLSYNVITLKVEKKNFGALVRQRTIPTERSPLVGEVSANFSE
jgi:hypothetical protein